MGARPGISGERGNRAGFSFRPAATNMVDKAEGVNRIGHRGVGTMDFRTATDRMASCCTLADVAEALGASYSAVKQARMDHDNPSYRSPPRDWEPSLATFARLRAQALEALADELEG